MSATNEPQEQTTASGLRYIDFGGGDGAAAKAGDNVSVHYTGTLENGQKFDSSVDRNQAFQFPLGAGRVIKGWDEGVAGMRVGDKRRLIIPSDLGYGSLLLPDITGTKASVAALYMWVRVAGRKDVRTPRSAIHNDYT